MKFKMFKRFLARMYAFFERKASIYAARWYLFKARRKFFSIYFVDAETQEQVITHMVSHGELTSEDAHTCLSHFSGSTNADFTLLKKVNSYFLSKAWKTKPYHRDWTHPWLARLPPTTVEMTLEEWAAVKKYRQNLPQRNPVHTERSRENLKKYSHLK